ncbi:MAG: ATP-binding protein, partial [Patescibacteria group bacterium]
SKKIKEVMINLIDNAIHYTQHGSITLTVSDLEEKGIVRISVKDTGIGVLKEDVSSLFKKFSRMENAKKISSEGTGLGLYVAKLIVEDHKGVMRVESEGLNTGSEFIFELPIARN